MHYIDARRARLNNIFLIAGIIFIAFNLRPAITAVGPLISSIRSDMDLTNGMAGFLTTLPLLSFAVLSPVAPKLGQKLGNERTLWVGLVILLIGILLRSYGESITLFAGTALIGVGIAICNVLLPSLIKHKFPDKAGIMTSFYTTAMSIFAALASGISIPLSHGLAWGWSASLMVWAGLAFVAILIWVPQLRYHDTGNRTVSLKADGQTVWRSKIAWQVTFFMGIQSFLFYCTIAWLPEILRSHGMSMSLAGWNAVADAVCQPPVDIFDSGSRRAVSKPEKHRARPRHPILGGDVRAIVRRQYSDADAMGHFNRNWTRVQHQFSLDFNRAEKRKCRSSRGIIRDVAIRRIFAGSDWSKLCRFSLRSHALMERTDFTVHRRAGRFDRCRTRCGKKSIYLC